jgi:hypothetical protein
MFNALQFNCENFIVAAVFGWPACNSMLFLFLFRQVCDWPVKALKMKRKRDDCADLGFYAIEKVINHRVEIRGGKWMTTFRCRWKTYQSDQDTWEPLANLETCPRLIAKYIVKKTKQHRAYEKANDLPTSKGRIAPPSQACLRAFQNNTNLWYIPQGFELVKSILTQLKVGNDNYLAVVFRHLKPDVVHVPQCLMEYYFPLETCVLHIRKLPK